jgi:hypothetical protein
LTLYLYDAAYAPNLDTVLSHGGIAMSCYLTGKYAATSPQPDRLHAKGLGALGNYEEGAGELLHVGKAGGVDIGRRAATAYIGKGAPAGRGLGIAFSVDVNAPPSTFPAIGAAFDGIKQGLAGRFVALVYGEGALIDYLFTHYKVPGVEWLSGSSSFPGFDPSSKRVALVQHIGSPVAGTDQDSITNLAGLAPFIWWPAGSPYERTTDVLDPKDPEVIKLHKEIAAVYDRVWASVSLAIHGDAGHPNSQDSTAPLVRAVNTALTDPTGVLARVAQLQAAVAALADDVKAVKDGRVNVAPLAVSGTLSIGGAA